MIRRILVALDPDEDTPVATGYATEIALRFNAEVSGLAVVDTGKIARQVGPGGAIGATYYVEKTRKQIVNKAREAGEELVSTFGSVLDEAGVRHGKRLEEGVPADHVIEDMKYNDLLVIGRTAHFFYHQPERETDTLSQVVKRGVSPALVVGQERRDVENVVVTYDGSDPSARTMQRFAQMQPFGTDVSIYLVNVHDDESKASVRLSEQLLSHAATFLKSHGFERITEASMVGGDPAASILDEATRAKADLIVAGAHSVSAVRRMAFGSTTHTLLSTCTIPLFLFH